MMLRRRRSIRLQGYDYSQVGAYFVTICADNRECLFGKIESDAAVLSEFGQAVVEEWLRSAEIRQEIELGEFVVMPNHFHGIVVITGDDGDMGRGDRPVAPMGPRPKSLGALIAGFKSAVTKRINGMRLSPAAPVWQRNYYEHVIRNEADYARIVEYITDNPRRWAEDTLHPDNVVINDAGVGATGRSPLR